MREISYLSLSKMIVKQETTLKNYTTKQGPQTKPSMEATANIESTTRESIGRILITKTISPKQLNNIIKHMYW